MITRIPTRRSQSARVHPVAACVSMLCLLALMLSVIQGKRQVIAEQNADNVLHWPNRAYTAWTMMVSAGEAGRAKKPQEALALLLEARRTAPFLFEIDYNLARVYAELDRPDDAWKHLELAVAGGLADAQLMIKDASLAELREDPRFKALVSKAEENKNKPQPMTPPVTVENGVARITPAHVTWDRSMNMVRTTIHFPETDSEPTPVVIGHGEVGEQLRTWFAEGSAAGNAGDVYDNFDRGHSRLAYKDFPQLARTAYSSEFGRDAVFGAQLRILYDGAVVLGNSSTALTGRTFWRSNARLAYTDSVGIAALPIQYSRNHLYVYPEHLDHDPGPDGYGDVFATNTPYIIISQGSSGSDKPFLEAIACTLAAFQPETKRQLVRSGLLMPTVQMIFRMSNKQVRQPEDYLTGAAHPTVFRGEDLNVLGMIHLAHEITPDALPPLAQLNVLEEDHGRLGRDYFDFAEREKLFDSPAVIARVHRTTQRTRRMVVSGALSRDARKRPLTYHWKLLRGNADDVVIKPLNSEGSRVEIIVAHHPRRPIAPGATIESNRVDIGLFVHNGKYYSAPAFVTVYMLNNEVRQYDDDGRIQSVTYTGPANKRDNYVDPAIDASKMWRDEYQYDRRGELLGWRRTHMNRRGAVGSQQRFTADGHLVISEDEQQRPLIAQAVRYVRATAENGEASVLEQQLAPEQFRYRYADEHDQLGVAEPIKP